MEGLPGRRSGFERKIIKVDIKSSKKQLSKEAVFWLTKYYIYARVQYSSNAGIKYLRQQNKYSRIFIIHNEEIGINLTSNYVFEITDK